MKPYFAASLMCADFLNLGAQLEQLNKVIDFYHVDIMDGHFCKNITLSPDFVKACKKVTKKPIDVHLMTENPSDWIPLVAQAGADYISLHAETINTDAFRSINAIKSVGCKVGIVLNPATPLDYIKHYINKIDILTIMTVDVGYAGQSFIDEMLEKIKEAQRLKNEFGYEYLIQIDGSCNDKTFRKCYDAGARCFVMGSSGLFNLDSELIRAYEKMKESFENSTGIKV